ncbi:MAG: M1 family metallopeptidase [Rhodothermales bacterium]|nr:M1 family metallopeptidase [Rhodothermales bacterium]
MFLPALLAALMLPATMAVAQTTSDEPLSERRVSYQMDVTLDPEARTVTGSQRLTWRNPGNTPVDELRFHLYLNAFKPGSTFQNESGGEHRGFSDERSDRWGGVEITRMEIAGELPADLAGALPYSGAPQDLTGQMRFIQPNDGNARDETVMAVTLPQAVQPGETITLDLEFESRLPRITARTGWLEDSDGRPFFFVAQWFPKIAVYEVPGQRYVPLDAETGQWNAHQFHANSEFYADFGTYDVTLRVPRSYVVGASGVEVSEDLVWGEKTVRYLAEDVHDFAWTAYEGYREYTETWRHVNLRLLLRPEHDTETQRRRHFDAAIASLERFDDWVGPYPYTTLTLVDGIGGSNGMEYPTLITCGTNYMLPEWVKSLELVTVHEFGHQYFYGMLASNEFEEAWLDEGMNSYLESRIMDDAFGGAIQLPGLTLGGKDLHRLVYAHQDPSRGTLDTWSWQYRYSSDYGRNSYSKPATVMNTLEGLLGWDTMREFLRAYYDEWAFRHPTTRDLQATLERTSGQDMDWFFDQYVYGSAVLDYRMDSATSNQVESRDSTESWRSRVVVQRVLDGHVPTTVRMEFEDGSTRDFRWDGQDAWRTFSHTGDSRLRKAVIDPDDALTLEINRLNNGQALRGDSPGSAQRRAFASRVQQILLLFSGLF